MIDCKNRNANHGWINGKIYECENCGNHVCQQCAVAWREVCPNCFGRLFRIS